jgi:archaellum component FlaC
MTSPSTDAQQNDLEDLATWRARIDELKVQADLGRMETRDRIRSDLERVEELWSDLKSRTERLAAQAADAGDDLRGEIRGAVSDLREALRSALTRLADDLDRSDDEKQD